MITRRYLLRIPHQLPPELSPISSADESDIRRWETLADPDEQATDTAHAWRCHDVFAYYIGSLDEIAHDLRGIGHQESRARALIAKATGGEP